MVVGLDQAPSSSQKTASKRTDGIQTIANLNQENAARHDAVSSTTTVDSTINVESRNHSNILLTGVHDSRCTKGQSASPLISVSSVNTKRNGKALQRPSGASEAEKNRKAKLAAMHWAEGESDNFEDEAWSGSDSEDAEENEDVEENEDESVAKARAPHMHGLTEKSRIGVPGSKQMELDAPNSGSAGKARLGDWDNVISSDEEMVDVSTEHSKPSVSSARAKRVASGLKPVSSSGRGK